PARRAPPVRAAAGGPPGPVLAGAAAGREPRRAACIVRADPLAVLSERLDLALELRAQADGIAVAVDAAHDLARGAGLVRIAIDREQLGDADRVVHVGVG